MPCSHTCMAINNMISNLVFHVKGEMAFVNSQESTPQGDPTNSEAIASYTVPREKDKRQIEDQSEGNSSKQTIRTAADAELLHSIRLVSCYTVHRPCAMLYCP